MLDKSCHDVYLRLENGAVVGGKLCNIVKYNDLVTVSLQCRSGNRQLTLISQHVWPNFSTESKSRSPVCRMCSESAEIRDEVSKTMRILRCSQCACVYHPKCHVPPLSGVELECALDNQDWLCRNCLFGKVWKAGGASREGELAQTYKIWRRYRAYNLQRLVWDTDHRSNLQKRYCYCGGPGQTCYRMLQCCVCKQWYHEGCIQGHQRALVPWDSYWVLVCACCHPDRDREFLQRLPLRWVDLAHLSMLNVLRQRGHNIDQHIIGNISNERISLTKELLPWLRCNWAALRLPELSVACMNYTPKFSEMNAGMERALLNYSKRFEVHENGDQEKLFSLKAVMPLVIVAPPPFLSRSTDLAKVVWLSRISFTQVGTTLGATSTPSTLSSSPATTNKTSSSPIRKRPFVQQSSPTVAAAGNGSILHRIKARLAGRRGGGSSVLQHRVATAAKRAAVGKTAFRQPRAKRGRRGRIGTKGRMGARSRWESSDEEEMDADKSLDFEEDDEDEDEDADEDEDDYKPPRDEDADDLHTSSVAHRALRSHIHVTSRLSSDSEPSMKSVRRSRPLPEVTEPDVQSDSEAGENVDAADNTATQTPASETSEERKVVASKTMVEELEEYTIEKEEVVDEVYQRVQLTSRGGPTVRGRGRGGRRGRGHRPISSRETSFAAFSDMDTPQKTKVGSGQRVLQWIRNEDSSDRHPFLLPWESPEELSQTLRQRAWLRESTKLSAAAAAASRGGGRSHGLRQVPGRPYKAMLGPGGISPHKGSPVALVCAVRRSDEMETLVQWY